MLNNIVEHRSLKRENKRFNRHIENTYSCCANSRLLRSCNIFQYSLYCVLLTLVAHVLTREIKTVLVLVVQLVYLQLVTDKVSTFLAKLFALWTKPGPSLSTRIQIILHVNVSVVRDTTHYSGRKVYSTRSESS